MALFMNCTVLPAMAVTMPMKKWILKAIVQKMISVLPFRNQINYWFQKYVTRGVALNEEHLYWKLTHARDHLSYLRKYGNTAAPVCLELGTGWYPIVPILLYLHGAARVQTIDLNAHLTKATLQTCLNTLLDFSTNEQWHSWFPDVEKGRWGELVQLSAQIPEMSLDEALARLHIEAVVGDARHLATADATFDFICSNNTFEHIFPDVLADILQAFKRVLKPGGVMSHFVDLSDHFAHFDQSINIYNFLRFSEAQWKLIDNVIQPQNRWRWPQYQALYQSLDIPLTEEDVRPGDPDLLRHVPVHKEWQRFSEAELAISHGYLVSC